MRLHLSSVLEIWISIDLSREVERFSRRGQIEARQVFIESTVTTTSAAAYSWRFTSIGRTTEMAPPRSPSLKPSLL